jgi:hypothetical protein
VGYSDILSLLQRIGCARGYRAGPRDREELFLKSSIPRFSQMYTALNLLNRACVTRNKIIGFAYDLHHVRIMLLDNCRIIPSMIASGVMPCIVPATRRVYM